MENDAPPVPTSAGSAEGPPGPSHNGPGGGNSQKLRKRTKTGCLTCRKRRIKCGEERPTCGNCIKSKRPCEGYNQRIIFKPAIEQWPGLATIPYHTSTLPGSHHELMRPPGYSPGHIFSTAAPQRHFGIPIDEFGNRIPIAPHMGSPIELSTPQYQLPHFYVPSHQGPTAGFTPISPNAVPSHQPIAPYPQSHVPMHQMSPVSPMHPPPFPMLTSSNGAQSHQYVHMPHRPAVQSPTGSEQSHFLGSGQVPPSSANSTMSTIPPGISNISNAPFENAAYQNSLERNVAVDHSNATWTQQSHFPDQRRRGINRNFPGQPLDTTSMVPPSDTAFESFQTPLDLNEAAREFQIDEPESEDDQELSPREVYDMTRQEGKFELFRRLYSEQSDTIPRGYTSFLPDSMLNTYFAEHYASPLKNPHTARVFFHFISATSISISIFERQSKNISELFLEPGVSPEEGLWTHTLPMMALNHQGLLHAMLALSSLHIAKLQNGPTAPSMKHYTYSIKRIHNSVGKRNKRHLTTTLAATLLLAFYEVMTADHSKWCWHLRGASYLVQELNFRRMSYCYKMEQSEQSAQEDLSDYDAVPGRRRGSTNPNIINEELVSKLVGRRNDWGAADMSHHMDEPFDSQKYQIYQDLFWWYTRQDTYQSIISGNRLLLNHQRWADCPPRAAVGKVQAVYGSHDHVILILGRIADYCAKDRERKLRAIEFSGGRWQPDPELMRQLSMITKMGGGPPPMGPTGPSRQPTSGLPSPGINQNTPMFYGMAPMPTNVEAPEPYKYHATTPPYQSPSTSSESADDLAQQTLNALNEWRSIYDALDELGKHFGPNFQPLPDDLTPDVGSPYGRPLIYPGYDIAVVWALYYAAYIVLIRGHPAMPPFALVASGVAIPHTQHLALKIGAIATGMMPHRLEFPLNPSLGSTLCEVLIPCFVAGVQFMVPDQRHWLVDRARRLEDLTGWASIGMIAAGCEIAWERMSELGKGPPYQRRDRSVTGHQDIQRFNRVPPSAEMVPDSLSEQQKVANINQEERLFYAMGILGEAQQPRRLNADGSRSEPMNGMNTMP